MPTYEYVCSSCANAWEEVQRISESALEVCPKCNQHTAKRQISGGNFILKGGGWYADLYSSTKPASNKSGESGEGGTSSDSKSDSKPASKDGSTAPAPATTPSTAAPSTSATSATTSGSGGGSSSKD